MSMISQCKKIYIQYGELRLNWVKNGDFTFNRIVFTTFDWFLFLKLTSYTVLVHRSRNK